MWATVPTPGRRVAYLTGNGCAAHDGRKVLHVIEGELVIEFEGRAAERLGPGDCVVHDGRIPHRWTVPGPGDTRLFLVVARPPQP